MGSGEDSAEGAKEKKPPEEGEADGRPRGQAGKLRGESPGKSEVGRAVTSERAERAGGRESGAGRQGAAAGRAWLGAPPLTLVAACFPPRLRFPHLLRA